MSISLRPRGGLTLVEVMVALVIVAVGLLGLAGSSALLLRSALSQAAAHRASQLSALRTTALAAIGCAAMRDGSRIDGPTGIRERWQVGAPTNGVVTVDDSLEWSSDGRIHHLLVRGAVVC
jgi:prepilin-type N-terminal cleavage/methylation domain-containing protein